MSSLYAPPPAADLLRLLGTFDLALLSTDSAALLSGCRAAIPSVAHHSPFPAEATSVYRYHAEFAALALASHAPAPAIPRARDSALAVPLLATGSQRRRPLVVLHPGSGAPAKSWPPLRFVPVARALRERGLGIVWSYGSADGSAADALSGAPARGEPVIRDASPFELARRLGESALYIGMDSGVSHLAAAVGCPSVLLFGPTNAEVWAPPGAHVRVVLRRHACAQSDQLLPPCPIPLRGESCARSVDGVARCMLAITPEDVLAAVDTLLSERRLAAARKGR